MDSLNIDNIFEEKSQNSINNVSNVQDKVVKFTFYITYAFLMTTATVTFIEAIRTKDIKIRNILNLETCISIVAAFFYGMFMKKINVKEINYKDIKKHEIIQILMFFQILPHGFILAK